MWLYKLDFVLLGISVLFIPFFGLSSTIDPVLMPRFFAWTILSLVLSFFFLIRLCISPDSIDRSILRRIIFPVFLAYFLFSMISLTKAVNLTEGLYEVLKISVSIVYLFLAAVILSRNKDYIPALIKIVVISAVILSLIGFYEYFTIFFQKRAICNITGTMGQKNQYSSALFLMLPFCLYACLCLNIIWRFISVVPIVLGVILILMNQTRSVWLAIFISTCVTTITVLSLLISKKPIFSREEKTRVLKGFLAIAIVLVISFGFWGYLYLQSDLVHTPNKHTKSVSSPDNNRGIDTTPTNSEVFKPVIGHVKSIYNPRHKENMIRISMWQKTLKLIRDNIIIGVGPGNWKIVFPSDSIDGLPDKTMFKTQYFVRPENDYLWVFSEVGIVGFLAFLSTFGIIFWYIFKILNQSKNTNDKLLSIVMFFGFVGYMVFSGFTFPKERIFHSMFLLLMMAVVISTHHRNSDSLDNIPRPFMFVVGIPAAILLIFAAVNGYTRLNAEIHTKRAFAARKAKAWPSVIYELDKGYSVFATLDPMSTPLKWYRGEANFLLNNVPEALEDFKKAYKAHPYHIHLLNNLATCYEMTGNHNQAIRHYNKALKIYPEFEDALINLGAAYYNAGRYKESYKTLLKCTQNKQNPRLQQYLEIVEKKLDK